MVFFGLVAERDLWKTVLQWRLTNREKILPAGIVFYQERAANRKIFLSALHGFVTRDCCGIPAIPSHHGASAAADGL
jgi:hypothetical protein